MAFIGPDDPRIPELSILMVSYNACRITLAALDSLFRHPPPVDFEVILIDNASPDGCHAVIDAAWPQLRAIAHADNVGFAMANNLVARQARGRRLLLLNPDTVTLPHSMAGLWDFAERTPARGIWGGRTLFADMSLNPTSCWHRITLWSLFCGASGLTHLFPRSRLFNVEAYGDWQRDREADVDIVTGCFLLIDTALWQRLGGFDRQFFMYAEEADLCLRARRLGARPGITPTAEIVHLSGASEATAVEKLVKTLRGRVTLLRKHWSRPKLAAGLALMLAWSAIRAVGSHVVSGRRDGPGAARDKWGAVWRRRHEWLAGYPSPER